MNALACGGEEIHDDETCACSGDRGRCLRNKRREAGNGAGLSVAAYHDHRAVRGRRNDRRHCPHPGRAHVAHARAAAHRRERRRGRGTTGSTRAMRANPDGYTIELGNMGTHAASVALYPTLAYNPQVDFAPIGMAAGLPVLVVGKKDLPPNDLKEFATYVRANAETLNMAHAGVGSIR